MIGNPNKIQAKAMISDSEIIDKITTQVNWYGKHSTGATLDQLLECKDKLVGYNYHLAELVSEYFLNYSKCYYIRKIKIARIKNVLIKNKTAITHAESIATEQAANEFEQEVENEAMAQRLDNLLRQSNKVVDAIQQRISVLKKEREEIH